MYRGKHTACVMIAIAFMGLVLAACGAQATAQPAPQATEMPRATAVPPTAMPAVTEAQQPLPSPAGDTTPGIVVDLNNQAAALAQLGGYHYEGVLNVQEAGKAPTYLRVVEDIDAAGNFHIVAYDKEEGQPVLDLYYIEQHVYIGQQGMYMDIGVQSGDQVSALAAAYQSPFQLLYLGMSNLQPVGPEAVNGIPAIKYSANFEQWAAAYVQARSGTSYTANGFVWVSEAGAILKSDLQTTWTQGTEQGSLSAHSEISQVGQVAPLTPPK